MVMNVNEKTIMIRMTWCEVSTRLQAGGYWTTYLATREPEFGFTERLDSENVEDTK